LESKISG